MFAEEGKEQREEGLREGRQSKGREGEREEEGRGMEGRVHYYQEEHLGTQWLCPMADALCPLIPLRWIWEKNKAQERRQRFEATKSAAECPQPFLTEGFTRHSMGHTVLLLNSEAFCSITLLLPGMLFSQAQVKSDLLRRSSTDPVCTVNLQAPTLLPVLFFLRHWSLSQITLFMCLLVYCLCPPSGM